MAQNVFDLFEEYVQKDMENAFAAELAKKNESEELFKLDEPDEPAFDIESFKNDFKNEILSSIKELLNSPKEVDGNGSDNND